MGNCIVVVQFDLPKRTEEQAIKGGTSTAPVYRDLGKKGLIRKDYLNGDTGTGGVYLWESRAAAEASCRCFPIRFPQPSSTTPAASRA